MDKGLKTIIIVTVTMLVLLIVLMLVGYYTRDNLTARLYQNSTIKTSLGIPISGDPTFGSDDAPVTIIYFFDYQCKWCRKFDLETFPKLKENFIDKGKLRFIFKDYAFLGRDSVRLAMGAECIYRQYGSDKFLKYHLLTYQNQCAKGSGWGSKEKIVAYSASIENLDVAYLDNCIENKTYLATVTDDTFSGMLAGVSSTPTFVIGDKKMSGAQPYSVFQKIIENPSGDILKIAKDSPVTTE